MSLLRQGSLWALFMLVGLATAHGGHENVPEGSAVSDDPIVRAWSDPPRKLSANPFRIPRC